MLDLEFSDGLYHVYLEFFAGGNVILTDADRKMLAVLRIVSAGEDGRGECRNGAIYEAGGRAMPPPVTREIVTGVLEEAVKRENEPAAEEDGAEKKKRGKFQKKKKKGDDTLKRVLGSRLPEFSPVLVEHVLLGAGVDPQAKAEEVLASEETVGKVVEALHAAEKILGDLTGSETKKGYIIAKEPKPREKVEGTGEKKAKGVSFGNAEAVEEEEAPEKVQEEGDAKGLVFDDFHPFLPRQFVGVPGIKTLEYDGFNTTVDTFVGVSLHKPTDCADRPLVLLHRSTETRVPSERPRRNRSKAIARRTQRAHPTTRSSPRRARHKRPQSASHRGQQAPRRRSHCRSQQPHRARNGLGRHRPPHRSGAKARKRSGRTHPTPAQALRKHSHSETPGGSLGGAARVRLRG